MRVLVTGSAGFIGRHVVAGLFAVGHDVEGYDWEQGDLYELGHIDGFDAVVNLAARGGVGRAARNPGEVFKNNAGVAIAIRGALAPLPWEFMGEIPSGFSAPAKYPAVVHVSSFSVYGQAAEVPTTEMCPTAPTEVYGASKLAQELAFTGYEGPLVILRLSSVYGFGMKLDDPDATVIAKIAKAARDGETFEVFEDGQQTRDLVHVDDVAACISKLLLWHEIHKAPFPQRIINVCSGRPTSIIEACEALGCKYELKGHKRAGDMRNCLGANERMKSLLGREPHPFTPKDVLLNEGVA